MTRPPRKRLKLMSDQFQQNMDDQIRAMRSQGMHFVDFSTLKIDLVQNEWVDFRPEIGKGIRSKLTEIEDDYLKIETRFDENSELVPHYHSVDNELILVREGKIRDTLTNNSFVAGDHYWIPKDVKHHIVSENGALLTIYFSPLNKYNKFLRREFPESAMAS